MTCMTANTRRTIRLDADAFREAITELGYRTPSAFAVDNGLAPSTLSRCLRGQSAAGPAIVATVLMRTGKPFDDLFHVDDAA